MNRLLRKIAIDIRRTGVDAGEIEERILGDARLQGTQIIILITAIIIASIGLNMNSTAVVIGAMLISPVMGAISAIGYGGASNRMDIVLSSLKKLVYQVLFSLIAAAIYFSITPITAPTAELLARTEPSMWDVAIALFGGIAGAIGNTREEKGNVIPGVAIATALIPPLCTAGYGIATHQWAYFSGALYLFIINAVFIAIGSFIVFLILDIPRLEAPQSGWLRFRKWLITGIALLVVIPSVITAYHMVQKEVQGQAVKSFVERTIEKDRVTVLNYRIDGDTLLVTALGASQIDDQMQAQWQGDLADDKVLNTLHLQLIQPGQDDRSDSRKQALAAGDKFEKLAKTYQPDYERAQRDRMLLLEINREVKALFPSVDLVQGGSVARPVVQKGDEQEDDSLSASFVAWHADVYVKAPLTEEQVSSLQRWLEAKLSLPVSVQIFIEN